MIRQISLFIIVFCAILSIFALLNHQKFEHSLQLAKTAFLTKVEQIAKYVSAMYFERDSTFKLFLQDDVKPIEKLFVNIQQEFPEIKELKILNANRLNNRLYEIESLGESLSIRFNVYNEDLNLYVLDRVVLALIDPQEVLRSLGIRNIKIGKTGKDFVPGLKYERTSSNLDIFSLLNATLIALIVLLYSIWNNTMTKYTVGRRLWKETETERKALEIILDLTGKYLQGKIERPYQT
ncbi:MAG: hypothetical protein ACK40Q_03685, partial [Pseudothermotoga sp.]